MPTYKLLIEKLILRHGKHNAKGKFGVKSSKLFFTLIDTDRGSYPSSYICTFPKINTAKQDFEKTKFSKIFKGSSSEQAKALLIAGLQELKNRLLTINRTCLD